MGRKESNQTKTKICCYFLPQGGFEYKKAIVDSIITIIEENAEAKEAGLAHFKKFLALSLSDVVFVMLINVKMPTISIFQ